MLRKIKKIIKRRKFLQNSIVGEKTIFDECSVCVNLSYKKENILIGKSCFIRGIIKVDQSGKILIGNNTYIGGNSVIGSTEKILIGSNVIISTDVHIYDNNNHPTSPIKRKEMCESENFFGKKWHWSEAAHKKIVIEDNVWIGERSTILKGVTIGKGSIIACNSVVTHNVPPYTVVAGNPAQVVKNLENDL